MKTDKLLAIKILRWAYLGIFLIGFFTTVLLHAVPKPFLDIIRMPTFIRAAEPYLGFPYDPSLLIYQITLLSFLFISLVDSLSLFFFSSNTMRKLSAYTSLLGVILIGFVGVYFLYSLFVIGFSSTLTGTILIYLTVSFLLFILDIFTFRVDEDLVHHLPKQLSILGKH